MARKKATSAKGPEQSGEDVFLEQTGETAEGFAGVEDSGGEVGVDSMKAPGRGSIEQPGPESMTPPLEESEAIIPSDETPLEDAGSTAPPVEVPEEEPPGEGPHETVGSGAVLPPGGEKAEWPPAEGSVWPEFTGDGGAETENHGPREVVSVDLSTPVDASAAGAASPAEGEGDLPDDPVGGELPSRSGVEPRVEEILPVPGNTPPEPTDRQKFYGLKFNRLNWDLIPDERQEWNSIYASYRGRSALAGTIIGTDPYSARVRNPETGEMERQTMYCATMVPYRVHIVILATEMWEQGWEWSGFVIQNMVDSSIGFIIIKVDRESGFAIGSRRLALWARRYCFAHRPDLNAIGIRLKCRAMAVGPRRCLVEFHGYDINLTQREIRHTPIPDLWDEYRSGQELECIVKVYDPDIDRVEISAKETESSPCDGAEQRHPIGSRWQAMIAGGYGGGILCDLPDGAVYACNYSYQHEDSDFLVGDTVILVAQRYAKEKKQMYGKIFSKWQFPRIDRPAPIKGRACHFREFKCPHSQSLYEERMDLHMKVKQFFGLCVAMLPRLQIAVFPASAAGDFFDVPAGSPYYESVTYLTGCGITAGTGGYSFSPERSITVREWAALLFQAFDGGTLPCDSLKERSELCIQWCYQNGQLGVSAAISPDRTLCRGELLLSVFRAAGLSVYNASPHGCEETGMSLQENAVRIGGEFGLCPEGAAPLERMTRGDAAMLLLPLLTQSTEIATPPILDVVPIHADVPTDLNRCLLEIACVPKSVLQAFHGAGWEYHVSPDYLRSYSEKHGTNYIGLTSCSEERTYVSTPSSMIHRFGRFPEWVLRLSPEYEMLYREETEAVLAVLREYAATNSHEYFVDYFAFWIRNSADEARMEWLKTVAPQTHEYFPCIGGT